MLPFEAAIQTLFQRRRTSTHRTLDDLRAFLDALGHPERHQPNVQIVGTNGKGSTAVFLEAMCLSAGLRVGCFTSPHLLQVNERFRIDGQPASEQELDPPLRRLLKALDESPLGLPFFDLMTALAALLFAQEQVDIAIFEAGMGGAHDATSALPAVLTVLTTVGLDHQEWLGQTREEIAKEKAGAFRPHRPVICGIPPSDPLFSLIEERAAAQGSTPLLALTRDFSLRSQEQSPHFAWHPQTHIETETHQRERHGSEEHAVVGPLRPSLRGSYQHHNLSLAAAAFVALASTQTLALKPQQWEAVSEGASRASWPGRMQQVTRDGRTFLLDGAHNQEAIDALCQSLPQQPIRVVFGCANDKPIAALLQAQIGRAHV